MSTSIRPLVAGNWKMNGTSADFAEIHAIANGFNGVLAAETDAALCFPATLLHRAAEILSRSSVKAGGQDCHPKEKGPHTGDVSAEMLKDAGAGLVIVGHSERRSDHDETDAVVAAKALAAHRAGLVAVICVGETEEERRSGSTLDVLARQIAGSVPVSSLSRNTVVAYEPVWAIGTGLTPTVEDVASAHARIRSDLTARIGDQAASMRILYGGSVKPSNAGELLSVPDVNGALVGGASLKAADFLGIAEHYLAL